MEVRDKRLWRRIALTGAIGLGDAYMDGWWDCRAIDVFVHKVLSVATTRDRSPWSVTLAGIARGLMVNLQSLARAFQVGERHYDLGNDLYRSMLGEDMVYSCAYWQAGADSLGQAQRDKLELVCRKLGLQSGMRILDIGCWWGSLCAYAAEKFGVSAVGLTVSRQQVEYARKHYKHLPVEFHLQDYRTYSGDFDALVSIGMFEHVGYRNYGTYMKVARRCLCPEGLFLLHTIGANLTSYRTCSWHTKHIFPNGYIPSLRQIARAAEGRFVVEDVHNIGPDYDRTLMCWYNNFEEAWPRLKGSQSRYDDRFHRMWRYYLLSCAGVFRARDQQVWQWLLSPRGLPHAWRRPALENLREVEGGN